MPRQHWRDGMARTAWTAISPEALLFHQPRPTKQMAKYIDTCCPAQTDLWTHEKMNNHKRVRLSQGSFSSKVTKVTASVWKSDTLSPSPATGSSVTTLRAGAGMSTWTLAFAAHPPLLRLSRFFYLIERSNLLCTSWGPWVKTTWSNAMKTSKKIYSLLPVAPGRLNPPKHTSTVSISLEMKWFSLLSLCPHIQLRSPPPIPLSLLMVYKHSQFQE